MALPPKKSELLCFCDIQYRWIKRSSERGVEVSIELNENPKGQMIIVQCPRIFRDDMVEEIIEQAPSLGWKPEEERTPIMARLTKRGLALITPKE